MNYKIKNFFTKFIAKRSKWSIGIYQTKELLNPPKVIPQTITNKNIDNLNASFVADPFLFKHNNKIYCFFEIKDKDKNKGVIGYSESIDGINFKYKNVILEEKYHLSYPNIYKINNEIYMIPEIGESREIRIYKAVNFPDKWIYYKTILKGKYWADPTLFFYNNKWYLFVSENTHNTLYIYISNSFDGEYTPHPLNPIYSNNKKFARCGGNIFKYNNLILRPAQDCSKRYGEKLYLMKIDKLSPTEYKETFYKTLFKPIGGKKWNAKKMHHFSFIPYKDKYLVATDGEGFK